MDDAIGHWVFRSQDDLDTAADMFAAGRWVYTVYMCHMSLERLLKALVAQETGEYPPRTHDLKRLLELANLDDVSDVQRAFLEDLSGEHVLSTYTDDKTAFAKYSRELADGYLKMTRVIHAWLLAKLKS